MRFPAAVGLLGALLVARPAFAQSQTKYDVAGYLGAVFTPVGALPTPLSAAQLDRSDSRLSLRALYGHGRVVKGPDTPELNAVGLGAAISLGPLSLDATAGYQAQSCPIDDPGLSFDDCTGHVLGGVGATLRLFRSRLVDMENEGAATVALDARLGYASRSDGGVGFLLALPIGASDTLSAPPARDRFMAASVGLPITLPTQLGNARVTPFVTPALVVGSVRTGGIYEDPDTGALTAGTFDETGARFQLAGGLSLVERTYGLGLQVSAQRVFVSGGATVVGLALTYGGPVR